MTISNPKPILKKKNLGHRLCPNASMEPPPITAGKIIAHAALGLRRKMSSQPTVTRTPPQITTALPANPTRRLRRLSATTHRGLIHSDGGDTSESPVRKNSGSESAYS